MNRASILTARPASVALFALFAVTLPSKSASAQAYQCSVPRTLAPAPAIKQDGPSLKTAIAGYTLAASWSPNYCKTSGDTRSMQCSRRNGRFGFILHGLWPEGARNGAPQWCANAPAPSPDVLRRNLCMTPSPALLAREWAKHGTCMTRQPETYFKVSAILWRSLHWPDADRLSRQKDLTVGDLRKAFVAINPDWRSEYIGVELSRTGWLRGLHLCYGRDFMPQACRKRQFGPPDSASVKIWRGL